MDIIEKTTQLNQKSNKFESLLRQTIMKNKLPKLKDITTLVLKDKFIAVTYMKKKSKGLKN